MHGTATEDDVIFGYAAYNGIHEIDFIATITLLQTKEYVALAVVA